MNGSFFSHLLIPFDLLLLLYDLPGNLIVAQEVAAVDDLPSNLPFQAALSRLRSGVEVWLNGSAQSPFLYDRSWGGIIMCGCNYMYENGVGFCANKLPDCPALTNQGQNFGAGFYNDHHYHFGYVKLNAFILVFRVISHNLSRRFSYYFLLALPHYHIDITFTL